MNRKEYNASRIRKVRARAMRPWVHAQRTFSPHPTFGADSPSGQLLDCLIALIEQPLEYVRAEDALRYRILLPELKAFHYKSEKWAERDNPPLPVRDLPIASLGWAMQQWAFRCFEDARPLWATFALEAAEFVRLHCEGHHFYGNRSFGVESMLHPPEAGYEFRHSQPDAHYKREFTSRMGRPTVVCLVPEGGSVTGQGKVFASPGNKFIFEPSRCLLSSGFYDAAWVQCKRSKQEFDLMGQYALYGKIFVDRTHSSTGWVPPSWIVAEIRGDDDELVPVPWAASKGPTLVQ